jgi:hypothetical protein
VARLLALFVLALVALTTGCGRSAVEAPMVPTKTAEHDTHVPRRTDHPHLRLIAPPPAYGNKVVMAKSANGTLLN